MAVDRTKYLEAMSDFRKSINELSTYNLNVYTAIELYYKLLMKQNEVITELNRFENVTDDVLSYLVDEGVTFEVAEQIKALKDSGELTQIIEQEVFTDLSSKIANNRKINVRDLGAKGDGVTDDTQAIKQALALCGSPWENKPSIIYFPAGVYKYTESLKITSNYITIEGESSTNTILKPVGTFIGIELLGTETNKLYANELNNFAMSCENLNGNAIQCYKVGLEFKMNNVNVFNTQGKGFYFKSIFDCEINNIHARNCTDIGIVLEEQNTVNDGYEEMSYITMNRCTSVNCATATANKVQWLITGGNNIFLNNCKSNEGYTGLLFNGDTWNCRINNFYFDGLNGTDERGYPARAIVVNGEGTNDLVINGVYTWNCPHTIHLIKGTSVSLSNITRNKWNAEGKDQEIIRIETTYNGRVDCDSKYYSLKGTNIERCAGNLTFQASEYGIGGIQMYVKEVTTTFYTGYHEIKLEITGWKDIIYSNATIIGNNSTILAKDGKTYNLNVNCVEIENGYTCCHIALPENVTAEERKDITVRFLVVCKNPYNTNY